MLKQSSESVWDSSFLSKFFGQSVKKSYLKFTINKIVLNKYWQLSINSTFLRSYSTRYFQEISNAFHDQRRWQLDAVCVQMHHKCKLLDKQDGQ